MKRYIRGQALVEFALVASLLILLMLGIFMFGQLLGWLHTLNNAPETLRVWGQFVTTQMPITI